MNSARSMTVAFLLLGACRLASAQPPDANELLREVQAKYTSLQSYSDVGEVRATLTTSTVGDGARAIDDPTPEIPTTLFRMKLARFQMFSIAWKRTGSLSRNGALWSDGGYRFFNMMGLKYEPKSTEEGFGAAAGVSGGVTSTIPRIFFNLPSNAISAMQGAVLSGEESIDGDDCYVVKSHSEMKTSRLGVSETMIDRTLWISKTSKLIRQERADISADLTQMNISDFDLKNELEKMGQKATDETVQEFQAMSADALKTMGKGSSTSRIETHREIKIDEPMSPSDFREEPQAPPVPDPVK